MSIAGIRSNRGDIYQNLVAFDWALTVLADPDYEWIETDSTTYFVDDVVIGKTDGTVICCQCKKNQPNFKAWSFNDLADELDKAIQELSRNPKAQISFYSRSNFGALEKLREFSVACSGETDYRAKLTKEHKETENDLSARIAAQSSGLSTYDFITRISFEITKDFGRYKTILHERLRQIATNSNVAFDALWRQIDTLGGHEAGDTLTASTQHRLTKENLEVTLHKVGAILAPSMSVKEARQSFSSTSAIGRSWVRDIAGHRIQTAVLEDLLTAIDNGKRSVLLTGAPGSGKTCVMLSLQEALEQRAQTENNLVPLFIQSREFADLSTVQERHAQGLPEQWVEQAGRLAEYAHVVVVIDSLDVLSIAREHNVLTYFLAQIDQLLLIPNVTVVTACRDFDHKYDRRIAVRQWDLELECKPLDWEEDIVPLLEKLELDLDFIDEVTRELIRNPRELALFVDLALNQGSFSVVTSQALAQRYLDSIVQSDPALGDTAMSAIEDIAEEMLKSRSLSIPHQRFNASHDILRRLKSLNVIQETHDGKLTFGHQTLLDVLVISGAMRRGVSLNEFISELPPVPFVRPSIRSFVAQLAVGERLEFRKQLRALLTGDAAFHIRRLVAEAFAQQPPHDDDWSLIRDLRYKHRDVYQVIYTNASLIEWHYFWLDHLVPLLKESHDKEGIIAHVNRISQWANSDAAGVIGFWEGVLSLSWVDVERIAERVGFLLPELSDENLSLVGSLLDRLLSMPKPEHGLLGRTVAQCVSAGVCGDNVLWRYIAGDITKDDMTKYDFGKQLHCRPHEFGEKNEDFLKKRMANSTTFLDLALEAIEQWSHEKAILYGESIIGYRHGFIRNTSYDDIHSQTDTRLVDDERILFDAIETAILDHAQKNSDWWQENRRRLCFNEEGALCYIGIKAVTDSAKSNLDLISELLCDRNLLEFELSFELGELIHEAFIFLNEETQDTVMATIQTVLEDFEENEKYHLKILKKRAEYIAAIPCHLRSVETQAILNKYESLYGTLIPKPFIYSKGGAVLAPFSYTVFLNTNDDGVVRLLKHYEGHSRDSFEYLVGGQREVGMQLREASSRQPSRFLHLSSLYWSSLDSQFRDDIMDGIASHVDYRYGNLKADNNWDPVEKPDCTILANKILGELERHSTHWHHNRSAAKALRACAHVIQDTEDAERLIFLSIGFKNLREESSKHGADFGDLINTGINMITGNIAEALMILANNLLENSTKLPDLLPTTLRQFSGNEQLAIRALILRHLPYLQSLDSKLGWELFQIAMKDAVGLWNSAERCLYYLYHDHFEMVAPCLERIYREGNNQDMETWGRISALAALTRHIDIDDFIDKLNSMDITEAWKGAASVWTHVGNIRQNRDQCLTGIKAGLDVQSNHAIAVAQQLTSIFRETKSPIIIPAELIQLCFSVFETENKNDRLIGFSEWLNAISQRDPEIALAAVEIYLAYVNRVKDFFHDYRDHLVQLVTRLFAEAEEREESDNGEMLKRVVGVQDLMLSLGLNSMNEWLKAAERQ